MIPRCRRQKFDPWVGKIPWWGKWQPTPVFLPGESHAQRSLVGYSPWGCKELDITEHACMLWGKKSTLTFKLLFSTRKSISQKSRQSMLMESIPGVGVARGGVFPCLEQDECFGICSRRVTDRVLQHTGSEPDGLGLNLIYNAWPLAL